jgi:hypothetical protein
MRFISGYRVRAFLITILVLRSYSLADEGHHSHEHDDRIPDIVINPQNEVNPWTNLVLNNDPENFQIAIVTDRTGGMREGIFASAIPKINLLQPEFVMSVGDLINGYTEDFQQLRLEWDEFDGLVDGLDMPFFYVAGNHDYSNPVMAEIWKERYGVSYYHFVYRDVLFVMLNSNDGGGIHKMSERQVGWLQGVLEANPDPRWTLVFVHTPLWDNTNQDRWPEVDALLAGRKHTVFSGHKHQYAEFYRNNANYYMLATTGGGSRLRGTSFGEFDHVVWLTMTNEGPVLANLLLEGIWPKDVRTNEMRSYQRQLVESGKLVVQPILYRNQFKEGETEIRLTNDSDLSYQIDLNFKQIANVALTSERSRSLTVPPNEVTVVKLSLKGIDAINRDQAVVEIGWDLKFKLQGKKVSYNGKEELVVIRELPVKSMQSATVDGSLQEWGKLPYRNDPDIHLPDTENWRNDRDASFRWGMGMDNDFLYLGVEVTDERIISKAALRNSSQDSINIQVDARPAAIRNHNRSRNGSGDRFAFFSLLPDKTVADTRAYYDQGIPKGSKYVALETKNGYNAEIAIPLQALDDMAGGKWNGLRVNLFQTDTDKSDDGVVVTSFNLPWNVSGSLPGSGSFYRP